MRNILFSVLCVIGLSACADSFPPVMFMPKTVDTASSPITDSALGQVSVTAEKSGVGWYITPENFRIALIETFKRANIFGDDRTKAITIDARIVKATFPSGGFEMTSDLAVHYQVRRADGTVLLDEDVSYQGRATISEEFFGSAIALLAFQRGNEGHFSILLPKIRNALARGDSPAK